MHILKKLFGYYLAMIAIFFLGRATLFVLYHDRIVQSDSSMWLTFLYGLKMDTIVASALLAIPLILLAFAPTRWAKVVDKVLRYYFLIVLALVIYMENATIPFFAEYDVRPNFKFVEYLAYPKEVFTMILTDYKGALTLAFGMIALFGYLYLRRSKAEFVALLQRPWRTRAVWFLPLALLLFIGIRSSFGHRPANVSDAMYSNNRILNEITKNSLHSVALAIYANHAFATNAIKHYGKMSAREALERLQKRLHIQGTKTNSTSPFRRLERTHFPTKKKKNLVIFLQESLGYQFVTPKITPEMLKLQKEGLWFDEAYSNGTRSVRGIAGVTSGFLAVPGKGVVKRPKSQRGFFTFASLLKPLGYHTMFLYGGEAHFDNMRSWFLGNGFDEIVEQKDFDNPHFVANWGVSDEDLVNKANEKFAALYKQGKPFAALMFSSSNHKPFDIPTDSVSEIIPGKACVENAVHYADYAIGKFIRDAKKQPYYKETVFVIIADHNIRVYGDDVVPVKMFHIPALILAEDVAPQHVKRLSTQPDVLATALDLLGKDFAYPILGHSIFSDKKADLNLLQFNETYALRVGNKVAVIRPDMPAETFLYHDQHLVTAPHDTGLEKDALGFIVGLNWLYDKQRYK